MSALTYKKYDSDDVGIPDKMTIYQDCVSAFNASPINARKCRGLLSKLIRLLYLGEEFPRNESTSLFFSISKLFQHKSNELRQIVYLAIKLLATNSDDVLMVTSSIMKDIQSGNDLIFKPNAIRTLIRIIDPSTIHAIERLFKNCIVDRNPNVSSAALVSSYHLCIENKDIIKHWINEIQSSLSVVKNFPDYQFQNDYQELYTRFPSSTNFHQYFSLGLLCILKSHDKMALIKLINQLNNNLNNPFATVQYLRYIGKILNDDSSLVDDFYPILFHYSNNKSEMISLEAIKIILNFKKFSSNEPYTNAILSLQRLLESPRTVTLFASTRLLNKVSLTNPELVKVCNPYLEQLVNHSDRNIATYSITTLLKTGSADTVDKLISTISNFMNEISDDFKIVVINAIRNLTLKFPNKYKKMLLFLIDVLKNDGNLKFKNTIVESLFDMIQFIPESKSLTLENLCEFIEDCEFPEITVRILNLLGNEGPQSDNPTLYIRHIYNRISLENSIVRASAVSALTKFALTNDANLTKSIEILLTRCLNDLDDEVRDRAAISLKLLKNKSTCFTIECNMMDDYISPKKKYSLNLLESKLSDYISANNYESPFTAISVPQYTNDELQLQKIQNKINHNNEKDDSEINDEISSEEVGTEGAIINHSKQETSQIEDPKLKYSEEFAEIEEFSTYGAILHSSNVIALTERETEFVVDAIKHVFEQHLVFQFNVENTLEDIELNMVTVVSTPETAETFEEEFILPITNLKPNNKGTLYVSFKRTDNFIVENFNNMLSYTTRDVDPSTLAPIDESDEGFQDEYQIEDLEATIGDYINPAFTNDFNKAFDELPFESTQVFNFGGNDESLQEVVGKVIESLSMTPLEGTENVSFTSNNHKLKLYGKSLNSAKIAGLLSFVVSKGSVVCKAVIKSDLEGMSEIVVDGMA